MADVRLNLGAWESDRGAVEQAAPVLRGDVTNVPILERFAIYVARAVSKYERRTNCDRTQPAAFVLVDGPTLAALRAGRSRDTMVSTGANQVTGRIHFVTETVARSVYETFEGAEAQVIVDRLEALALDNLPVLIYQPLVDGSFLEFFPNGTSSDVGRRSIDLCTVSISESDIVQAVKSVHMAQLITPDLTHPFGVWTNPAKGWPIKDAERGIQQFVRVGLQTRFYWCRVAMEQPDKDGRTDLELLDEATGGPGIVTRHATLELKVLRSRGETGSSVSNATTEQHISDGVNQAYSYAMSRTSIHRLLCCFDMRDSDVGDDTTFSHVRSTAATLAVKLFRWYLYRSSDQYRAAQVSAGLVASATGATT